MVWWPPIQGIEHEDVFDADLNLCGHTETRVGDVNGFAPPGDIHRVHNTSDEVTISLHIYGTDVTRVRSSVRRYYDPSMTLQRWTTFSSRRRPRGGQGVLRRTRMELEGEATSRGLGDRSSGSTAFVATSP